MPDLPHTQLQNFSLAEVYTRRKENNDYRIRLAAFGKTNREVASRLEETSEGASTGRYTGDQTSRDGVPAGVVGCL